jgi:hypothetical protein
MNRTHGECFGCYTTSKLIKCCGHGYSARRRLQNSSTPARLFPKLWKHSSVLHQIQKNSQQWEFFVFGAPGRTRTYKNGSEDRCDIHFTTGAYKYGSGEKFNAKIKSQNLVRKLVISTNHISDMMRRN